MSARPKSRRERKQTSRQRIVEAAARRMRARGVKGAGVSDVMRAAGLTHGGFYAHFPSKAELVAEAFSAAMQTNRARWFAGLDDADDATWLEQVVHRYLSRPHRDASAEGCPLPALSAEVSRESGVVRAAYETELRNSVAALESRLRGVAGERARERAWRCSRSVSEDCWSHVP